MEHWMARKPAGRQPARRGERGQALVLIAMALIGLLAFIGLMVDAGLLFIGVGHLRRAVDAAALAAAAQFREGRTMEDQAAAAREVIHLNGVDPSELILQICDPGESWNLQSLCPDEGDPQRKLIYIQAKTKVQFAFLTIIGFHDTEIVADAVSEAASVDVVLVIDTSSSMVFDEPTGWEATGNPTCNDDDAAGADGLPGECHPFEEVKQAAVSFVERMYFPYDRVALVTFDNGATTDLSLLDADAINKTAIQDLIRNLRVSPRRDLLPECTYATDGDPSGCTNTSIGGALVAAGNEFGLALRQEAVWVVVLLTDGAANASQQGLNLDGEVVVNRFCPPAWWSEPFCRDSDTDYRRTVLDPAEWGRAEPYNPNNHFNAVSPYEEYDADDFARDMADYVSCAAEVDDAAEWCKDSLNYNEGKGGQGALMYSIGLGLQVIQQGNVDDGYTYSGGDALLRYLANVGIDGDPNPEPPGQPEDACHDVPAPAVPLGPGNDSYDCGNYFFSETGAGLASVFESIASRVFTRLTQ
jgi:hypothetical protein